MTGRSRVPDPSNYDHFLEWVSFMVSVQLESCHPKWHAEKVSIHWLHPACHMIAPPVVFKLGVSAELNYSTQKGKPRVPEIERREETQCIGTYYSWKLSQPHLFWGRLRYIGRIDWIIGHWQWVQQSAPLTSLRSVRRAALLWLVSPGNQPKPLPPSLGGSKSSH